MDGGGRGQRGELSVRIRLGYGLTAVALIGLYPHLPSPWRGVGVLVACAGAVVCVVYGRRRVAPGLRRPWTLLLLTLATFVVANVVKLVPHGLDASLLIDAVGNLLVLAAAMAVIIGRGTKDLGGIVDAAVIAFAAGSVLWAGLPHRLGARESFAAQINLFVVVFTLTGVLGALLRLARTATRPGTALWYLLAAIALGIGGNLALAIGGDDPRARTVSAMLFMGSFVGISLFGLDPSGPRLMQGWDAPRAERISTGRLAFLGAAVATVPVVIGVRELLAGSADGLLLTAQGVLVSALVMFRIGLLSAQRSRAEQALEHQAKHDPLTHLVNRREFMTRLTRHINRGAQCTILFCDLDGFKSINDEYGHDTGDRLLIEVAHRLRGCVRPPHDVGRFGGDEFVVMLVNPTPEDAQKIRRRLATSFARPFDPAGGRRIGISIGVAESDDTQSPEQLIKAADQAMYRAKAARANPPTPVGRSFPGGAAER